MSSNKLLENSQVTENVEADVCCDIKPSTSNGLSTLNFEPSFSLREGTNGIDMSWKDVAFSVNKRQILSNVSGDILPNQTCAILGPSGAGKSTLLNILSGRLYSSSKRKVSGTIYINGGVFNPVVYRRSISYVLQEDCLYSTSTAREALEFSALLRLPSSTSRQKRATIVDELLLSLGLTEVQNTMCGSTLVRGLSGGEKKRVSIGVELVTNPQLLFLDEPTSGLDSYSAFQVVSVLKSLSRSGCAILSTIHQPSSEIFNLFDKCIVLAGGSMMYHGKVSNIPKAMEEAGFPIPNLTNPADFMLLIAQTKSTAELPYYNEIDETMEKLDSPKNLEDKPANFLNPEKRHTISRLWIQLGSLSIREFKNLYRDKSALVGRFGVTIFLNVLFGWIFFDAGNPNNAKYLINSHFGALNTVFVSSLFSASQPPLITFPLERVVFIREYSTGTYSVAPYFVSKIMLELPIYLATSVLTLIIVYFMIGFHGSFILLLLELFLIQLVAASYAFFLGAIVNNVQQAQELAPLVFVPQLLFTGFFISIQQIPVSIRWVQYICSLKYGINLAMLTEFSGSWCDVLPGNLTKVPPTNECQELLLRNDVHESLVWLYIIVLLAIFLVFRTGSFTFLVIRATSFTG